MTSVPLSSSLPYPANARSGYYLVCGEALFDLFVDDTTPGALRFNARMGGSPYNVAIGLSRLGTRSALFTGLSRDFLGTRLRQSLHAEGVDTAWLVDKPHATTLSLVALDDRGSPQYSFYGDNGADRLLHSDDIPTLDDACMGLHFGSYSLVVEPVASTLYEFAQRERQRRLISLDPNVRLTVEPDLDLWRRRLSAWIELADLVKVSEEDLTLLYPERDAMEVAREWLERGVRLAVLTGGERGAIALTRTSMIEVRAQRIDVVDTVGAGDTFQAALLHAVHRHGSTVDLDTLTPSVLRQWLEFAATAAAITCTRVGADLPTEAEVQAKLQPSV